RRPSFNREGGDRRSNSSAPQTRSFGSFEDKPWKKNTEDTRSSDRRPSFNREGGAGRPKSFGSEDKSWRKNTEDTRSSDRRPSFNREGGAGRPKSFGSEDKPWRKNTEGAKSFDRRPSFNREGGAPRYRDSRQRTDDYNPNAKYSVKKQIQYKELNFDPEAPIRLNKYLANAGICSRREADEFISAGVVSVNGEIKSELGTKVKRSDIVKFHDDPVKVERKVYLILNKPKNCVTTSDDPQERNTVMDIVRNACPERIYPVGRLDRNTTGVLILTNDGELASKLTHPKFLKKKIYHVHLDQKVSRADLDKLVSGVQLEDGDVFADAASYVSETERSEVGLEIHSGKNRIVRRMFESLGYKVIKLDRVYFAGMTKKNLKRGDWRFLTEEEVNFLRMGSYE
ncbi:MAG: pseudouridine synthase, partial [Bacteroidaceae bacterium]